MSKTLARLTRIAINPTLGALSGHVTIGRLLSGSAPSKTSTVDDSDYDSGPDDEFEVGTRNRQITGQVNYDKNDPGQQALHTVEDGLKKASFRYRVAEVLGEVEFIQDGILTEWSPSSGGRQDRNKASFSIQLTGPRVRQAITT